MTEPTLSAPSESVNRAAPAQAVGVVDLVVDEAHPTVVEPVALQGPELYAQHCAACHGERGDGAGLAATFLYPKPRNFREGRFRLVSTTNGVPTLEDLERVIQRGLPGSAMVPWPHLTAEERRLLAEQTVEFRRQGVRDFEIKTAEENGDDPPTDEYLKETMHAAVAPGEVFSVAVVPTATPESIARGKDVYARQGCVSCHGLEGRGDGQQQMVDSEGFATRPRDLTLGIYKGDADFASVFRRTKLGMPGSPMPASATLTDEQVSDVVNFVLSLSDEASRERHMLRRERLIVGRTARLPERPDAPEWSSAAPVELRTTPLWWRDEADPGLTWQALHDGREIAVRLTWRDATTDAAAIEADQFEDLVGMQLFDGPREPFLGMGAVGAIVDLWQWRAGGQVDGRERWQSDEYPMDSPLHRDLAQGKTLPDFVTARAAGNPLAAHSSDASRLTARGFGSTTFAPQPSQVVAALGAWHDGRWAVVLRRPLQVAAGEGVNLAPDQRCSAAFAVWDGAQRDRAGQKRITIWQDLQLEE